MVTCGETSLLPLRSTSTPSSVVVSEFVALQDSVAGCPSSMAWGLTEIVAVGAGGFRIRSNAA